MLVVIENSEWLDGMGPRVDFSQQVEVLVLLGELVAFLVLR